MCTSVRLGCGSVCAAWFIYTDSEARFSHNGESKITNRSAGNGNDLRAASPKTRLDYAVMFKDPGVSGLCYSRVVMF